MATRVKKAPGAKVAEQVRQAAKPPVKDTLAKRKLTDTMKRDQSLTARVKNSKGKARGNR